MRDYNGFSGAVRNKEAAWLRSEYASGRRQRPTKCEACGQDEGVFHEHCESYAEPFSGNQRWSLCYYCHLILHCRFRYSDRFNEYAQAVAEGYRLVPPPPANFPTLEGVLQKKLRPPMVKRTSGSPLLLEIAAGKYAPSKRPQN